MGIHDREYYRGETRGSAWLGGVSPVCNAIIAVNAVVFIAQQLFASDSNFVNDWLAASPEYTLRHFRVWQLLTATFLHGGPLHFIGNMLFLYLVGQRHGIGLWRTGFPGLLPIRGHLQYSCLGLDRRLVAGSRTS